MNYKYKISIIIPAYNAENTIKDTLNSILRQNFRDYEIIIIDDGSLDSTCSIVKKLKCHFKDDTLNIYSIDNSGPGIARNVGLTKARGEYIVFVDADDILPKNSLNILYESICDTKTDFAFGSYLRIDNINCKEDNVIPSDIGLYFAEEVLTKFATFRVGISLWNSIFKNKIIRENNLFFNHLLYGEDEDFIIRYLTFCTKVFITSKVVYLFEYNQARAIKRELSTNLYNYWEAVLDRLLFLGWKDSYNAIKRARIPIFIICDFVKLAYKSNTLEDFEELLIDRKNDFSKINLLDSNYLKRKTYIKGKTLILLFSTSHYLFYFFSKKIFPKMF